MTPAFTLIPDSLVCASTLPLPARLMAMVLLSDPTMPKVRVARAVGISEPTALRHWATAVHLATEARADVEAHRQAKVARAVSVLDALGVGG